MTSTCCNVAKQPNGQVTRDVDLELTADQELFRDTTRQFLQAEAPLASVRAWADTPAGFPRAWGKRWGGAAGGEWGAGGPRGRRVRARGHEEPGRGRGRRGLVPGHGADAGRPDPVHRARRRAGRRRNPAARPGPGPAPRQGPVR